MPDRGFFRLQPPVRTAPAYRAVVLDDAPVGYWRLDDPGGTTALDSSGNARHGTYTGGFTLGQTGRVAGLPAALFDGSSGLVLLPDIDALDGAAAFTVEAWVYPTSFPAALNAVLSKWLASTQDTFDVSVGNAGTVRTFVASGLTDSGSNSGTATGNIVAANTWTHIVVVFDGSQTGNAARLLTYVNGALRSMTFGGTIPATTPANGTANVRIGQLGGSTQWWAGRISDVALYNTALPPSRVAAHYRAGLS